MFQFSHDGGTPLSVQHAISILYVAENISKGYNLVVFTEFAAVVVSFSMESCMSNQPKFQKPTINFRGQSTEFCNYVRYYNDN